jgi:NADH:ubiquinone oxidoreductase subunit F (NADH-binding)
MTIPRLLPAEPVADLAAYRARGGGEALDLASKVDREVIIREIEDSGLRGRGGAGFPTGRKWRTVAAYASEAVPTTVVVNAAEGEPGTIKDRELLRRNPYLVLEGALVAARAVGADQVVVATKATFTEVVARVRTAVAEIEAAGWCAGVTLALLAGPSEYLFGEETALLEVVDGRPPFPRIAPPWRRGVVEVVEEDADLGSGSGLAAHVEMAASDGDSLAPPALAQNVETLANVPGIIRFGAAWFRELGTERAPGTVVCTLTGPQVDATVREVELGTPLIDALPTPPAEGGGWKAVLSGVANPVLDGAHLDTPLGYEELAAAGGGLGSAGFIVFDATTDMAAVAAGVARFLAVESCGQCTACKLDGLAISDALGRVCRGRAEDGDLDLVHERLTTITDGARCNLARQHQVVVGSILDRFGDEVVAHLDGNAEPVEPMLVSELVSIEGGAAVVDETFLDKQPDWTYDEVWSGQVPVDRFTDHRSGATTR